MESKLEDWVNKHNMLMQYVKLKTATRDSRVDKGNQADHRPLFSNQETEVMSRS